MSTLMNEWLQDSPLKDIALNVLLQKSKSKDHLSPLERRIELWESEELVELVKEAETIQKYIKTTQQTFVLVKTS